MRGGPAIQVIIAALFLIGGSDCAPRVAKESDSDQIVQSGPTNEATLPSDLPVVTKWDGGVRLANIGPRLLFAAWSDGTVVFRASGELRIGRVSRDDISGLLERLRQVGLFELMDIREYLFPDGPEIVVTARSGDQSTALRYHGHDDWNRIDQMNDTARPAPSELRRFVKIWNEACAAMEKTVPRNSQTFDGPLHVRYPEQSNDVVHGAKS